MYIMSQLQHNVIFTFYWFSPSLNRLLYIATCTPYSSVQIQCYATYYWVQIDMFNGKRCLSVCQGFMGPVPSFFSLERRNRDFLPIKNAILISIFYTHRTKRNLFESASFRSLLRPPHLRVLLPHPHPRMMNRNWE